MEQRPIDRLAPILLLIAVYGIVWIDLFLPQPQTELFSTVWYGFSAAKSALRIVFILLAMRLWLGFEEFNFGISGIFPTAKDVANGILVAASAVLVALLFALLALFSGATNPLLSPLAGGGEKPLTLLAMILSSLGIGYSEELFFRFFAVRTLEKACFSASAAILASALIFGVSHGSQGIFGMIGAAMLALIFSFFRTKGKGLHALALGHALYDLVILLAVT
ncbi:MAG TPA: CPBP family intramembrane glutamic endopeptidase [Rectinemataceae bacterium]|nr:CPBP family intramembrane glutamic endopeptidase [Rectinemataceae bacterium]